MYHCCNAARSRASGSPPPAGRNHIGYGRFGSPRCWYLRHVLRLVIRLTVQSTRRLVIKLILDCIERPIEQPPKYFNVVLIFLGARKSAHNLISSELIQGTKFEVHDSAIFEKVEPLVNDYLLRHGSRTHTRTHARQEPTAEF